MATSPLRPLYWSVRREVWENRSIYVAPLAVAAVVFCGFLYSTLGLPRLMRAVPTMDPAKAREAIEMPYNAAAGMLFVTAFVVGVFYCLDALHGERRDRSLLFWKSLPVSDLTTVLAKASIPLVVLPLLVFPIVLATQTAMLLVSTIILLVSGVGVETLWATVPMFPRSVALLYGLVAISLWHAPLYAWMLLVSGWARRAVFLWAVLPVLAAGFAEMLAFRTLHVVSLLQYRLIGWFMRAFVVQSQGAAPVDPLDVLSPGKFISTPGLWIGLVFAVVFLAAAVRLRRSREPI